MGEAVKTKRLSFELDEDMLGIIAREFSAESIAMKLSEALAGKDTEAELEDLGSSIFKDYGRELMRRSLQLGEEYPDRTYELLREAHDQTGSLAFPLIPQRFIEIAFLSIQHIVLLPVIENSARRFIFEIEDCRIYDQIKNQCGEVVANSMVCKNGCLEACRTAFDGFSIDIDALDFEITSQKAKEGRCRFVIRRGSGEFAF